MRRRLSPRFPVAPASVAPAPVTPARVTWTGALLLAAALLLGAAAPARADDDCRGRRIGPAAAIAIAASVGLVVVKEVECDDGRWEVEGWSVFGVEMEVEIDARTGRIVEVEIDD